MHVNYPEIGRKLKPALNQDPQARHCSIAPNLFQNLELLGPSLLPEPDPAILDFLWRLAAGVGPSGLLNCLIWRFRLTSHILLNRQRFFSIFKRSWILFIAGLPTQFSPGLSSKISSCQSTVSTVKKNKSKMRRSTGRLMSTGRPGVSNLPGIHDWEICPWEVCTWPPKFRLQKEFAGRKNTQITNQSEFFPACCVQQVSDHTNGIDVWGWWIVSLQRSVHHASHPFRLPL